MYTTEGQSPPETTKHGGNEYVARRYDRGEDVPPQNEAAEMALAILMHEYN